MFKKAKTEDSKLNARLLRINAMKLQGNHETS
jgi:hypothetical protein